MTKYKTQFFSDVTQIRRDMTGLTGSGVLVLEWETPQVSTDEYGNADEVDLEYKQKFVKKVNRICKALNEIETGQY